jgi:hypothetical protein
MINFNQALVLMVGLLFASASHAQTGEPQYPADASFHFVGTTEFVVIETVRVYSETSGNFLPGLSPVVEEGTVTSELWVDTVLVDAQPSAPGESTATGVITTVRGTPAADQVGEPLTESLLLAPYGIGVTDNGPIRTAGVTESNVQITISNDNLDEWSGGTGDLYAEGLRLETDNQNLTWVTSGFFYNFDIEAQSNGDGTNTFVAQEVFFTTEIQGEVPAVEGTIFLERRVASTFNGTLQVPQGSISAVPTIPVYGLILIGFGLILIASRRLQRHQRNEPSPPSLLAR